MLNDFRSLIWLRTRYLLSAKAILFVCVLTPIFDFYLLILWDGARETVYFLNMALSMVYSMTGGTFVSMIVSEEKEKKNLKTLRLSGVTDKDYLLSVVFFPIFFASVTALFFPFPFGTNIPNWGTYLAVVLTTVFTFVFLNLSIALLCKTQQQTVAFSMFFVMLASILPAFVPAHQIVKQIAYHSFIGANTDYMATLGDYSLTSSSFLAQVSWLFLCLGLSIWAYRRAIIVGN